MSEQRAPQQVCPASCETPLDTETVRCELVEGHEGNHVGCGELTGGKVGWAASLPESQPKPPVHPFEIRINIGAEEWDYVLRTLDELARHIADHGPDCNMCSGGAGGSHSVTIAVRDVTKEQFREELESWRISLKK